MELSFGRHRGQDLRDIPAAYLKWVVRTVAIDGQLRLAIQRELRWRKQLRKRPEQQLLFKELARG